MAKIKIFALGGLNEIGKNMYVIDIDNNIFVFDAGLKYADDSMLGVDYIIPKYDYLIQNKKKIKGIFIRFQGGRTTFRITFLIKKQHD